MPENSMMVFQKNANSARIGCVFEYISQKSSSHSTTGNDAVLLPQSKLIIPNVPKYAKK
ncbi:hypothetical protein [uncultured Allofournierella sp.]|uniref:hypothetical protein n=1 Tax=uncultured Allofournierella sp. TaxID=1940258 RepID=UPI00375203A7